MSKTNRKKLLYRAVAIVVFGGGVVPVGIGAIKLLRDMREARRQYKAHPAPAPDSIGRTQPRPDTASHADTVAHRDSSSHRIKGRRIDNPIRNGRAGV